MNGEKLDIRITYSLKCTEDGTKQYYANLTECRDNCTPCLQNTLLSVEVYSLFSFAEAESKAIDIYRLKKTAPEPVNMSYKSLWDDWEE
jgi:hypothetical protein